MSKTFGSKNKTVIFLPLAKFDYLIKLLDQDSQFKGVSPLAVEAYEKAPKETT